MKTHWLHMNESTYDKRRPWESLCIYHPSLQKLTGIHLILFQILPGPRSLMGLLCEDWNLLWAMKGRSGISYNIHWTIFAQSHSWKIFCEMNVYRKGFREEREVGRAGGEGKIIQTRVKAGSHGRDLTAQLVHLEERSSGFPGGLLIDSSCQRRRHWFGSWTGKIPHALKHLSPWATTVESVLWSPGANIMKPWTLEPVLCNERRHHTRRPCITRE